MTIREHEVHFAAVGDVHGQMHAMVRLLSDWERRAGRRLAFVLQVGDFEPTRDEEDLQTLAAPAKYRKLGEFSDFHSGRSTFPWPIWFIGGNHEPYGFLDTMPNGGLVAPNCHYLGRAGRVELLGLRIVGLSGIFSPNGIEGRPPVSEIATTKKKLYTYFSQDDVTRALEGGPADIVMVHDWPERAVAPADQAELVGRRRYRTPEGPGNAYARMLVDLLDPQLVLAGHLHWRYRSWITTTTRFAALGHIDTEREAFAVFRVDSEKAIVEIDAS